MGKLLAGVKAATEAVGRTYTNGKFNNALGNFASAITDVHTTAANGIILSLAKAWIGIGMIRPAQTEAGNIFGLSTPKFLDKRVTADTRTQLTDFRTAQEIAEETRFGEYNRYDYDKLFSLEFEDGDNSYFMPLSQTFNVRAKKRLNVSELVDGIDIIQQTRHQAKIIDCTLRIALRDAQKNLHIVDQNNEIIRLGEMLDELYENDTVFAIQNEMVNNTFRVTHCVISEYKFTPRVSMGTYTFEMSLMEVKYGDNVLTFDVKQIDAGTERQLLS